MGYLQLGWVHLYDYGLGGMKYPELLNKAEDLAAKVLAIDDSISSAHSLLSSVYLHKCFFIIAMTEGERAIALNPNDATWSVSITLRHWPEEFIVAILRSFPVWAD
jgi:hypothetical protein